MVPREGERERGRERGQIEEKKHWKEIETDLHVLILLHH